MISNVVRANIEKYKAAFLSAKPFRHVAIDDFLETEYAENLLRDFPSSDKEKVMNETDELEENAGYGNLAEISDFYAMFERYVMRKEFLDLISNVTGIDDLLADERRFGGGTHENFHGQEEDAHVDFNYDEERWIHHRLNLFLYLNKEWDESWGGRIELHSNPRRPEYNEIKTYSPLFNRCVIFETNEYSWYGFEKIQLPANKQDLSRKSVSMNLFTKERASEEILPAHGAFYVQRPLPKYIRAGHVLSEDEVENIQQLIARRDGWIARYQNKELDHSRLLNGVRGYVKELESKLRLPLTGYVLQQGHIEGYWADGCVAKYLRAEILALKDISHIRLFGYVPSFYPTKNLVIIQAGTFRDVRFIPNNGAFEVELPVRVKSGTVIDFSIQATESMSGQRAGLNQDTREAAFFVSQIRFD